MKTTGVQKKADEKDNSVSDHVIQRKRAKIRQRTVEDLG